VLGLGAISSVLAPAPQAAFLELGHFVLLFVTAGVIASAVRRARKQTERLLLGAITIGVLLYAVYFIVGYGVSLTLPALQIGRDTIGGFVNTRFFNQYQTWTLPLLGGSFLALPKSWRIGRGLVFFLIALWWTLVLGSDVRGTVVAMAIGALGVTLLFQNRSYPWLGLQGAALLAGGILYYFLFTLGGGVSPEVVERLGEVGQSNRLQNWRKCLEMAWRHPWVGVGPMHFAWPPYDFAVGAHPHNAFLQWLAEWGVPSTVIMSSLTIWGGWSWMQQERRRFEAESKVHKAVAASLVAAVLAGAAHAMVSGVIVMPVSQVFLVLVGGWAWGRYQAVESSIESSVPFSSHLFLCMLLAGSITIVGTSLWDLTTVEDRRKAFRESVNRSVYSPRYWGQGYIGVRNPEVIERARRNR
jgi:O-antigen ligase